jgi:hypothetical protein
MDIDWKERPAITADVLPNRKQSNNFKRRYCGKMKYTTLRLHFYFILTTFLNRPLVAQWSATETG